MQTLRGAGGFGDAFYMYPVLKYKLENGVKVEILTKYPEVYTPLKHLGLIFNDRYAKQPDRECRYAPRYSIQETTTYEDTLIQAGVPIELPFKIDYQYHGNTEYCRKINFPTKKKICVIRNPSIPMKGKCPGDSAQLIPNCRIYQEIINKFKNELYFVLAGNSEGEFKYKLRGIDEDLTYKLNIPQIIALGKQADIVFTQTGFFLPLCESQNSKCFILFAEASMKSNYKFFPYITPKKVINNYDVVDWAIDCEPFPMILSKFERLLNREVPQ